MRIKKIGKWSIFVLIAVFCVSVGWTNPVFGEVADLQIMPSGIILQPNDLREIDVDVKNNGVALTNVSISANGNVLSAEVNSSYSTLSFGANETKRVRVKVFISKESVTSSQETFDLTFAEGGKTITKSVGIKIADVNSPSPTPGVNTGSPDIKLIAPTSYTLAEAGKEKEVMVTIKNNSQYSANQVNIFPKANKDISVRLKEEVKSFNLTTGRTKDFAFIIKPDANIASGDYTVDFDYSYYDDKNNMLSGSGSFYVKISTGSTGTPSVGLFDFTASPTSVVAGQTFNFSMNAKNLSGQTAEGVQVTLEDLSSDTITITNATNNKLIGSLNSNSEKEVSYRLTTNQKMKTGSYPITVNLKYKDKEGKLYEEKYTFYVNVMSKEGSLAGDRRALVVITNISRPTATYGVGGNITITMTLQNKGENTATNIRVKAEPEEGVVPKSANIQLINSLAVNQTTTLTFSFSPTAASKSQNYNIAFNVEYETGAVNSGDKDSKDEKLKDAFVQYVGVNVSNPEADKKPGEDEKQKSIPKIIVSKYAINPIIVEAGHEFDLDLVFKNTHATKSIHNIKVALSVIGTETEKGNVFTPVNSSNTFYIDAILPHGETAHHMTMFTVPDAKAKNYIITIKFEYEDAEGAQLTATEEVGVNVQQVAKYDIGDVNMPMEGYVGENVPVSFNVHNTGKVTLNNLKVKIEGEGIDGKSSEMIFGNFAGGSFDYYDGYFTPTQTGDLTFDIIVTYDDDTGERHEKRIEKTIMAMDAMPPDFGPGGQGGEFGPEGNMGPDGPPQGGFVGFVKAIPIWGYIAGGVGILAVAGGAAVLIVRHNKKKGMELDE